MAKFNSILQVCWPCIFLPALGSRTCMYVLTILHCIGRNLNLILSKSTWKLLYLSLYENKGLQDQTYLSTNFRQLFPCTTYFQTSLTMQPVVLHFDIKQFCFFMQLPRWQINYLRCLLLPSKKKTQLQFLPMSMGQFICSIFSCSI